MDKRGRNVKNRTVVFIAGFIAGIIVLIGGGLLYARLGLVNPRADIPVPSIEVETATKFLDASLARRVRDVKNPVLADETHLAAGMKLYQSNCAGCHGDIAHQESPLAEALYPRAPQFQKEKPDMPENQNFYLIKHGIRYSGMPAWGGSMTDEQTWEVVGFLSHMDKLSPVLQEQWRAQAR
jgi:mono/diheme cytochrome c family protein